MARIAVLHNTLDLRGGADAVCLTVCEALQEVHDVTLVTLSRSSLGELNRLFDTGADVPVRRPPGTAVLGAALDALADWVGPQLPLRSVLLDRYVRRLAGEFDLAVSTANEFALPLPTVQYVHYPQFNRRASPEGGGRLDPLWSRAAGLADRRLPADATLVANSSWTADVVGELYDRRPTVLHPPVDPLADVEPWADRERGAVTVGRIAPDKRVLDAIAIVDGVRAQGHDLHLHVVGSTARAYRQYVQRVARAAADRPYVTVERDVPRSRVEELIATHRYGLNAKPQEHFGMALAEFVAGGMLAFAPDSGGQRDVLDGNPDRLFGSVNEGVELLSRAIETDAQPELPRDRFASERFREGIRALVAERLDG